MTPAFGSWRLWAVLLAMLMLTIQGRAQTGNAPLHLEAKIPLGTVSGRIDHLAIDLKRQRLFVAELGYDSIGIVDLAANRVQSTLPGLKEPQGIAYEPSTDTVYVANGGDGSVRILRAGDLTLIGRIDLGDDADNVRIDRPRNRVLVGYGNGALAIIDPTSRTKVADIRLKAAISGRVYWTRAFEEARFTMAGVRMARPKAPLRVGKQDQRAMSILPDLLCTDLLTNLILIF